MEKAGMLIRNVKLRDQNRRLKRILEMKQKEQNRFLLDLIYLKLKLIQNKL